jgi:hypothetical protein
LIDCADIFAAVQETNLGKQGEAKMAPQSSRRTFELTCHQSEAKPVTIESNSQPD